MFIQSYARKVYSQNQEDGIIEYLLSQCNDLNKRCIEIGVESGIECNTANLIKHHKYSGVLIDKSSSFNTEFYNNCSFTFINSFVNPNNIVELVDQHNLRGEYDVLSIDVDGIDYWILKSIIDNNLFTAKVIVLEYQDIIGPELSLTIPFIDNFDAWQYDHWEGPNYCGASLKAFVKLLNDQYAFIGCEPLGFNGFWVNRNQQCHTDLEMKDITSCFDNPKVIFGMNHRWPRTKHLEWISV